jgi:hypothetical protein
VKRSRPSLLLAATLAAFLVPPQPAAQPEARSPDRGAGYLRVASDGHGAQAKRRRSTSHGGHPHRRPDRHRAREGSEGGADGGSAAGNGGTDDGGVDAPTASDGGGTPATSTRKPGATAPRHWKTPEITPGHRALQHYKRQGYLYVNRMLRGSHGGIRGFDDGTVGVSGGPRVLRTERTLPEIQGDMKAMGALLAESPKYDGDTVFRAVSLDQATQDALRRHLTEGSGWRDGGFVSTSRAASMKEWLRDSQFARTGKALVEIDLSKARGAGPLHSGVDVESSGLGAMVGGYKENEVLFHPGQQFRVVEVVAGNGPVNAKLKDRVDSPVGADLYVRLEALPFTARDARDFEDRVDGLGGQEAYAPPMPPGGPRGTGVPANP